jgi:hypothetical protein
MSSGVIGGLGLTRGLARDEHAGRHRGYGEGTRAWRDGLSKVEHDVVAVPVAPSMVRWWSRRVAWEHDVTVLVRLRMARRWSRRD